MPRITTFTAPEREIRPSATGTAALETAGRRINPLYQSIAQDERAQGQIKVQQYRELLWPQDIAKLYEDRAKNSVTGVRLRVIGAGDTFGGPSENFSSDPTQDYQPTRGNPLGLSTGEFGVGDFVGHAQVSRGAGALGRALSDGGFGLSAKPGPGMVEYAGGNGYDYPTAGGLNDLIDYTAANKAQKAYGKYNEGIGNAADAAARKLQEYWSKYGQPGIPTGPVDASGNPVGIDQYGNPSARQVPQNSGYISNGGFFSGLVDYIGNLGGGPSGDTGM